MSASACSSVCPSGCATGSGGTECIKYAAACNEARSNHSGHAPTESDPAATVSVDCTEFDTFAESDSAARSAGGRDSGGPYSDSWYTPKRAARSARSIPSHRPRRYRNAPFVCSREADTDHCTRRFADNAAWDDPGNDSCFERWSGSLVYNGRVIQLHLSRCAERNGRGRSDSIEHLRSV